jgi:transposase
MEEMNVAVAKNGKRMWTTEQKVNIVNELKAGVPSSELARKYNITPQQIYHWKSSLESFGKEGIRHSGAVVAKSEYQAALRRIEELEQALGRKTLEIDILKKSCLLKGLKLPEEK